MVAVVSSNAAHASELGEVSLGLSMALLSSSLEPLRATLSVHRNPIAVAEQ